MKTITTVERKRIDPHRLYGVVVGESDMLMLLHQENNFLFDGYMVVRKRDITKVGSSLANNYCVRLMKKEGLWEKVPRSIEKLPLDSWADLLAKFVGKVVILENERTGNFYIGPIQEITKTGVVIREFWPDGVQCHSNTRVPFSKITSMTFGDRYSTIHAKYLDNKE